MRLLQNIKAPARVIRFTLLVLLMTFGLNTLAHASHSHLDVASATAHVACGYCATFNSLGDTAQTQSLVFAPQRFDTLTVEFISIEPINFIVPAARSRAPPQL